MGFMFLWILIKITYEFTFTDKELQLTLQWSRYSGGSGAPMWTFYAMGLDPTSFKPTEAALVQNQWDPPTEFPKMIWPTNYSRLACQVAFTLFTAGLDFAPKAIIDGKNIQEYLQDHLLEALRYFYKRIFTETDLGNRTIIGVESLNEVNHGLVGFQDITKLPQDNSLKKGTTPTPYQAMMLGMGIAQEVDVYEFRSLGPTKVGTQLVDPEGVKAWLPEDYDDSKYGWKRDPGWKLGHCIWAQHGVWDETTHEVLNPEYFKCTPDGQPLDENVFNQLYFTNYWNNFYMGMREVDKKMFLLCQPPVLTIPPDFRHSAFMDSRIIYSPHYYDGLTLINKHWNTWWNVDVLGILRGRYSTPAMGIKIGETAIRNCLRDQLIAIRQEGLENFGNVPCLMSETGMPFDLDNGAAYKTGDYSSQIASWDAIGYALEGSQIHHTLWTYCAHNKHGYGDMWNGEDFSLYSKGGSVSHVPSALRYPPYAEMGSTMGSTDTLNASSSVALKAKSKEMLEWEIEHGNRAEQAIARPFPHAISGSLTSYNFAMKSGVFTLEIIGKSCLQDEDFGTEIFVPEFNFPGTEFDVEISSGGWDFDDGTRMLTWWHAEGEQTLKITSLRVPEMASWWDSFNFFC